MPFHPANAVVWTEIPVRDLTAAQAFYEALLQTEMQPQTMGDMTIVDFKTDKTYIITRSDIIRVMM